MGHGRDAFTIAVWARGLESRVGEVHLENGGGTSLRRILTCGNERGSWVNSKLYDIYAVSVDLIHTIPELFWDTTTLCGSPVRPSILPSNFPSNSRRFQHGIPMIVNTIQSDLHITDSLHTHESLRLEVRETKF
jgi:hypothetical protein